MGEMNPVGKLTSTAVPAVQRGPRSTRRDVVDVTLASDGLGFNGITTEHCPACQVRKAQHKHVFGLQTESRAQDVLDAVCSPPVVLTAAVALLTSSDFHLQTVGNLLFFFGPSLALGFAPMLKLVMGRRFRL